MLSDAVTEASFAAGGGLTAARARLFKRAMDVLFASLILVLLAPIVGLVALCIKLSSPGPVLFAHRRVGRHGCSFSCYKFRTMVPNSAEILSGLLASDPVARAQWERDCKLQWDPRITRIGRALRGTSLDELPQLFNVLKGDMSLVGPRPVPWDELQRYGENKI